MNSRQNKKGIYILVSNDKSEIQKLAAYTAKTLASVLRSCLGPRAMQKMILTKINSIELTNDGNTILRELDVSHPSARCLIELAQTQDAECGDGTTSVLILAAEMLSNIVPLLKEMHPVRICRALSQARDLCLKRLEEVAVEARDEDLLRIVTSSVSTKLCTVLKIPIPQMALQAAQMIKKEQVFDIKNDIKIEKIPGAFGESEIIDGIIIEKDLVHSQMRRNIENPKILLLDCPLEYRKGESVTNMELSGTGDFTRALELEEEHVRRMCNRILESGADIVMTEKGISDLALSILYEGGVTAIRRVRKSDLVRISKATGTSIVSSLEDIVALGTAGSFEYLKIGKEYFCKLSGCKNPGAISVVLRGPTKDLLNELERNFMDAIKVARNVLVTPKLLPGGGATEMALSINLASVDSADLNSMDVYKKCAEALKIIPTILSTNSGAGNVLENVHSLEMKHKSKPDNVYFGINGITGSMEDTREFVMEPFVVKSQCVKSAFECVMQLLRVDGIIESRSS